MTERVGVCDCASLISKAPTLTLISNLQGTEMDMDMK